VSGERARDGNHDAPRSLRYGDQNYQRRDDRLLSDFFIQNPESIFSGNSMKGYIMHDDIMGMQLIPLTIAYLGFLAILDWVRAENAVAPAASRR